MLKQKAPLLSEGLLFLAAIMMMAVMPVMMFVVRMPGLRNGAAKRANCDHYY